MSVVICTRDRPQRLRGALEAVFAVVAAQDEVIVVDSASRGTGTRVVAEAAAAKVLRCDEPGASRARNAGWRAAAHELVAFTDDDCRPAAGWIEGMALALADADVGFAFGRVTAGEQGQPMSLLGGGDAADIAGDDPARYGGANNLAARVDALQSVGGFDEVLGAGAPLHASEDKDLAWRLLRAGWRGRYTPEALVVHDTHRGRLDAVRTYFSYGIGEGALRAKQVEIHAANPSGWPQPLEVGWRASLRQARANLVARYEFGVVLELARAAGAVTGRRRARRYPCRDGRFVAP